MTKNELIDVLPYPYDYKLWMAEELSMDDITYLVQAGHEWLAMTYIELYMTLYPITPNKSIMTLKDYQEYIKILQDETKEL